MIVKQARIALVGPDWDAALSALVAPHERESFLTESEDDDPESADFLVCYGDSFESVQTRIPRERRIVIISEPPEILTYHARFLAQFGTAISPFTLHNFSGRCVRSHPAIPWFYGCRFGQGRRASWKYDFDELNALPIPPKINAVSAVLSRKKNTALHLARVTCAEALEKTFGKQIKLFGSGFEPIDDKADAIDPYRFHLALENTRYPDYWTEKLADSYLGWSFPLYDGCPNVGRYFPSGSFLPIDVENISQTIHHVGAMLEKAEKAFDINILAQSRSKLLKEHSLPTLLQRVVREQLMDGQALSRQVLGAPEFVFQNAHFSPKKALKTFFRSLFRGS